VPAMRLVSVVCVVALVAVVVAVAWLGAGSASVAAGSPEPPVVGPGDPRSEGEGPGLVGAPLLVAAAVISLGLLAAAATIVVVRLTRED
jgi:hypothetical protein